MNRSDAVWDVVVLKKVATVEQDFHLMLEQTFPLNLNARAR